MKKAIVYYGAALTLFNTLLAFMIPSVNNTIAETFGYLCEGKRLPAATEWALTFYWWPHLFGVLFLAGCLTGIFTKARETALCHAFILCLIAELAVAIYVLLAYAAPCISFTCTLS